MFDLKQMLLSLPAILFAISIHEFSHAYTATRLGDDTPRRQGRLTLNPIAHFDLLGFIMLVVARFGWAKPVIIDPGAFKHRVRDELLVSVAGPLSNMITAVFFAGIMKLIFIFARGWLAIPNYGEALGMMLVYFVVINIGLAIFNILPIPPLDGSHFLSAMIPDKYYQIKQNIFRYGALILVAIIVIERVTNLDILPIGNVIEFLVDRIFGLFGISLRG